MISFSFEDVADPFSNHEILSKWITKCIINEGFIPGEISFVFGSDEWLRDYNVRFLNHDYYTDVITFDYTEAKTIFGDVLISVDRVYDNANELNVSRETEMRRVCIHGVLHLLGYGDKNDEDVKLMREKEDYYLCKTF